MSSPFNLTNYVFSSGYRNHPDKTAVIFTDLVSETALSYRELYQQINQLTQGLLELKLTKGSHVVLQYPIGPELLITVYALIAAGLVPILTAPNFSQAEMAFILTDSDARLQLPDPNQVLTQAKIKALAKNTDKPLPVLTQLNDPAILFYTSGTTGQPKGVVHAQHLGLGREPIRKYWLDLTEDDVIVHTGYPYWTYAFGIGYLDAFVTNATSIIFTGDKTQSDNWFELIKRYRVTKLVSSSEFIQPMSLYYQAQKHDISSLKLVGSAGESLLPSVLNRWQQATQIPIYESLGMSEMSNYISTGPTTPVKPGFLGKVQPGRMVSILPIDAKDLAVTVGKKGLLAVSNKNLGFMLEYWRRPKLMQEKFRGEWFLTGDIVSQDEQGYIKIYGRKDGMLNVHGGYLISPTEIESIIMQLPGIKEAACTVRTLDDLDQLVALIVSNNKQDQATLVKNIVQHCRQNLDDYKQPDQIIFCEKLPRNKNGKLIRKALNNWET